MPTGHYKRPPLQDRFWAKVRPSPHGCWEWTGCKFKKGYGQFCTRKGSVVQAHRLSYALEYGPFEDGMCVCHHCDNPGCVRPDHLFLGTYWTNNQDRVSKGRSAIGERSGKARLTEEVVRELRAWKARGVSYRRLGRMYGVGASTVRAVIDGKTWRHVT